MNRIGAALLGAMIGPLAACIVLPVPLDVHSGQYKRIDEETFAFLQAGSTARDDVLLRLGAPDWAEDNRFVYGIEKDRLGILFVNFPDMEGAPVLREYKALVIEFDASFVVSAWRLDESSWYAGPPTPDLVAMPVTMEEGGVTVGADPYIQPRRQQAILGTRLFASAGILPMRLVVRNGNKRSVTLAASSIRLELSDGRQLELLSPQETADRMVEAGATGDFVYRITNRALQDRTLTAGESLAGFVYFIVPPDATAREALLAGITLVVGIADDGAGVPRPIRLPVKGQG